MIFPPQPKMLAGTASTPSSKKSPHKNTPLTSVKRLKFSSTLKSADPASAAAANLRKCISAVAAHSLANWSTYKSPAPANSTSTENWPDPTLDSFENIFQLTDVGKDYNVFILRQVHQVGDLGQPKNCTIESIQRSSPPLHCPPRKDQALWSRCKFPTTRKSKDPDSS